MSANLPTAQADFDRLVSDLTAAAASYYESDVLLMTDAEYDAGMEQVQDALQAHPDWESAEVSALLDTVAAGQSPGGDVVHPQRMLSLDKVTLPAVADDRTKVLSDLAAFVAKVKATCSQIPGPAVVVEPKMDGLALRAEYRNGNLVLAATRGDGSSGEDVTANVLRVGPHGTGVVGLPATLPIKWSGEVRGEVVMSAGQFEEAQELRAERGGKPFVNARNATAGALRKTGAENWMPLTFVTYDLDAADAPESHQARMDYSVQHLGLLPAISLSPAGSTAFDSLAAIETGRARLGFDIDGAVIKANHDYSRKVLGEGSRTPYWAIAVKFPAEEGTSVIEDIEVAVGRTGRISLRARITPTFVGGTTVTYATLHNPAFVAEQGLGIGSKVVVKRAGDVIPRITAPLDASENAHVPTWTPPETCPNCDSEWDKTSLLWRCHSPECSIAGRLSYWASRDCLDIEGLGDTLAEALAETSFVGGRQVRNVADLYDLTLDEWANIILGTTTTGGDRRLGEANARKIMGSLADSKSQPFNRVITGLGIRMTGRSVGRWLAREFPTMDRLRAATVSDVAAIEKLGEVKATHIVNGLADMASVIDRLAAHGLNMGSEPDPAQQGDLPFTGKAYVVSGSVPGYTRTTVQERIEALGGKASSSVSKTTTALVTAETDTSKAKKAAELGIPIIDPDDFVKMLEG